MERIQLCSVASRVGTRAEILEQEMAGPLSALLCGLVERHCEISSAHALTHIYLIGDCNAV